MTFPSRPYMLIRCAPIKAGAAPDGPAVAVAAAAEPPAAPLTAPMPCDKVHTKREGVREACARKKERVSKDENALTLSTGSCTPLQSLLIRLLRQPEAEEAREAAAAVVMTEGVASVAVKAVEAMAGAVTARG